MISTIYVLLLTNVLPLEDNHWVQKCASRMIISFNIAFDFSRFRYSVYYIRLMFSPGSSIGYLKLQVLDSYFTELRFS